MLHLLIVGLGLSSPNSPWYLFWSGFGSDAAKVALIGSLVRVLRQRERHHRETMNRKPDK